MMPTLSNARNVIVCDISHRQQQSSTPHKHAVTTIGCN